MVFFFLIGSTGDPKLEFNNLNKCEENYKINLVNPVKVLNILSKKLIKYKSSFVCVFTSVAGLRGRSKRLFYCSAKSGLISYLSGLRQFYYKDQIKIINVVAGYMSTMKFDIKCPGILITSPEKVADKVLEAIKKNQEVIYTSFLWKIISFFILLIPEKIFKKLHF